MKNKLEKKEVYVRTTALIKQLIIKDPPFSEVSKDYLVGKFYSKYIKYYSQLNEDFRERIINVLIGKAKWNLKNSLFGFQGGFNKLHPELGFDFEEFVTWINQREDIDPIPNKDEKKFNLLSELKGKFSKKYPKYKYNSTLKKGFYSFTSNLCEESDVIISFDKGSYDGSLGIFIGLTNPEFLINISDLYGGGTFTIFFATKNEFLNGLNFVFEVLDFILPQFTNCLSSTTEK